MAPKGTPAPILRYLQEAAKEAVEDRKFADAVGSKGLDADYRPGDVLRRDLWREYKLHTEILRRIGMIKK
jgi:tripartite-type tricarboxylate transporter receptor subunit TctC